MSQAIYHLKADRVSWIKCVQTKATSVACSTKESRHGWELTIVCPCGTTSILQTTFRGEWSCSGCTAAGIYVTPSAGNPDKKRDPSLF